MSFDGSDEFRSTSLEGIVEEAVRDRSPAVPKQAVVGSIVDEDQTNSLSQLLEAHRVEMRARKNDSTIKRILRVGSGVEGFARHSRWMKSRCRPPRTTRMRGEPLLNSFLVHLQTFTTTIDAFPSLFSRSPLRPQVVLVPQQLKSLIPNTLWNSVITVKVFIFILTPRHQGLNFCKKLSRELMDPPSKTLRTRSFLISRAMRGKQELASFSSVSSGAKKVVQFLDRAHVHKHHWCYFSCSWWLLPFVKHGHAGLISVAAEVVQSEDCNSEGDDSLGYLHLATFSYFPFPSKSFKYSSIEENTGNTFIIVSLLWLGSPIEEATWEAEMSVQGSEMLILLAVLIFNNTIKEGQIGKPCCNSLEDKTYFKRVALIQPTLNGL